MMKRILILLLMLLQMAISQPPPEILQVEEIVLSLRLSGGDVIFYDRFIEYDEAFSNLKNNSVGRSLSQIEKSDLMRLYDLFGQLQQQTQILKPYFISVLEARERALFNAADDFSPNLFDQAEKDFHQAALKFQAGIPANSAEVVNRLIRNYREAEFEALKNKLLSEVRILIKEAKDMEAEKYAPQSFRKVNILFSEVESILKSRNYSDADLAAKASRLREESHHLLYVAQLTREMKQDHGAFENFLLSLENMLGKMIMLLNLEIPFSDGLGNISRAMETSVLELQDELRRQRALNHVLLDSLASLSQKINGLRQQLGQNLDMIENVRDLSNRLASLGVKVIQDQDQFIIRMNGISYPLGKIQPVTADRDRLEKVGEALRIFQTQSFLVRLGQSGNGNQQYHKSLADQRARYAALVLQSSGFIQDTRIQSEGVIRSDLSDSGHSILDILITL